MFEEAQLYSPVTQREDGKVEVHLGQDHPGFNDPEYRKRRNEIAAAAMAWTPGEPIPHVDYTETEHEIWRVSAASCATSTRSTPAATTWRARLASPCPRTASRSSAR
jgi:phenylalanine-4-hydroxylase